MLLSSLLILVPLAPDASTLMRGHHHGRPSRRTMIAAPLGGHGDLMTYTKDRWGTACMLLDSIAESDPELRCRVVGDAVVQLDAVGRAARLRAVLGARALRPHPAWVDALLLVARLVHPDMVYAWLHWRAARGADDLPGMTTAALDSYRAMLDIEALTFPDLPPELVAEVERAIGNARALRARQAA